MIFIPKENIRKWNLNKYWEYIIWKYNKFVELHFQHEFETNDCLLQKIYTDTKTGSIGYRSEVFKCPELDCNSFPRLRFNAIIKKYFCRCPSSMIGVQNTDESELEHFEHMGIKKFTVENTFFDNPLEAVLSWQNSIAGYHLDETKELMKNFFKISLQMKK